MERPVSPKLEEWYRRWRDLQNEDGLLPEVDAITVRRRLKEAPLHQGNVVLGPDRAHAYARGGTETSMAHFVFLIEEHVSIWPLLLCVVTAIARGHETLDAVTLSALEELVDSVLVVAVFELAASMKAGLWGYLAGSVLSTAMIEIFVIIMVELIPTFPILPCGMFALRNWHHEVCTISLGWLNRLVNSSITVAAIAFPSAVVLLLRGSMPGDLVIRNSGHCWHCARTEIHSVHLLVCALFFEDVWFPFALTKVFLEKLALLGNPNATAQNSFASLFHLGEPWGMPPLSHVADTLPQPALSWPTLLGIAAVMLAGMQGTLGMESAEVCRISRKKMEVLLSLEFAEVLVILSSEIFSLSQLQGALSQRMQWLHWAPPVLFVVAILELWIDVYFTVGVVSVSRVLWVPLSFVGENVGRGRTSDMLACIAVSGTAALSVTLLGWRQKWWWAARTVASVESVAVVRNEPALSNGALAFCIGWAFVFKVVTITVTHVNDVVWWRRPSGLSMSRFIRHMFRPNGYMLADTAENSTRKVMERPVTPELEEWYRRWRLLPAEDGPLPELDPVIIRRRLKEAPLHQGNVVLGPDRAHAYTLRESETNITHFVFLIEEHFSIWPLLLCLVVAIARVHETLDVVTLSALEELVDSVLVVAVFELAASMKAWLWGYPASTGKEVSVDHLLHQADKVEYVPYALLAQY